VSASVNMAGKNGAAIGIGVGGFGGDGGDAGDVILDVTGEVVTLGNDSHGLIAQSLGGGGGNGGVNVTGSVSLVREGTGGAASASSRTSDRFSVAPTAPIFWTRSILRMVD